MSYLKKGLGDNIKILRKMKGITQEQLAGLIEIDQRQLARIEAGESFATAETLEKISEHLNVSIKILFNIENKENDKMTLEVIENYNNNYTKLNNIIKKIASNNNKTEFMILASEALDKRIAREKLKGYQLGLDLK